MGRYNSSGAGAQGVARLKQIARESDVTIKELADELLTGFGQDADRDGPHCRGVCCFCARQGLQAACIRPQRSGRAASAQLMRATGLRPDKPATPAALSLHDQLAQLADDHGEAA
jgi:hypothetical protein